VEGLTYAAMILGWSAPVIALHWIVGAKALIRARRPLLISIGAATLYLGLADMAAIHNNVWEINEDKTLGLNAGPFVFEEWLFFLITNIMIVQTVILVFDEGIQEKFWRLWYRFRPPAE
jgi:lycopene beta-cyclase